MDAFSVTGCTILAGLFIRGSDITNLDGLANLTSVNGGRITILDNPALTNLDGLVNISDELQELRIEGNPALTSIEGLAGVTRVRTSLNIWENSSLANLDGLEKITSVGSLSIFANYALTNVDALINLTNVEVDLYISGRQSPSFSLYDRDDLTNLNGLANVRSVGQNLIITRTASLANIDGLANIASVGGGILISVNDALTNVSGLSSITSVGTQLKVSGNNVLKNLDGLEGVTRLGTFLEISDNYRLANIDALSSITGVGTALLVNQNRILKNVDGLGSITNIGEYLQISGNLSLSNLDGLANVRSVGNYLEISNNASLVSVGGLANVTSVGSYLEISDNSRLENLDRLTGITSLSGLRIKGNDRLVSLDGLTNLTSLGSWLEVQENTALTNIDSLASVTRFGPPITAEFESNNTLDTANTVATGAIISAQLSNSSDVDYFKITVGYDAAPESSGYLHLSTSGGGDRTKIEVVEPWPAAGVGAVRVLATGTVGGKTVRALLPDAGTYYVRISQNSGNSDPYKLHVTAEMFNLFNPQISISDNAALTNLDGLVNITNVPGTLSIVANDALTNIDGLANIVNVGQYLTVQHNDALINLDGLANITSITYLRLRYNDDLSNCQGLAPVLGWPNGPPDDNVYSKVINDNGRSGQAGCNSADEIVASVSGPTQPTILNAVASGGSISLDVNQSTTSDLLFPVTGYEAICARVEDLSEAPGSALLDNTPVSRTLTADGGLGLGIEVDIDITHDRPEHLYITLTTPQGTELVLWDRDGAGTRNLVGTFPTTLTPAETLNSVKWQSMDGDWVLRIEDVEAGPIVKEGVLNSWGLRISEQLESTRSVPPLEVTGVTRGGVYTCTVSPVTKLGAYPPSAGYVVSALSDLSAPSAPSIIGVGYGDRKLTLQVSVQDDGGADVNRFDATCTDGTNTFYGTSASSSITVSGLTNGVAYTCTVTASNSVGTSAASLATNPLTPVAGDEGGGAGQACRETDYTFTNQADIDAFATTGCVSITGDLSVRGSGITSLDGLINLTSVAGDLLLSRAGLINVDGLANLNFIGGELKLEYNYDLIDLDGLSNLASLGGLYLFQNTALANLDGLARITVIQGDVSLWPENLENLWGLRNITNVGGRVYVGFSDMLTNLDGLANLTSVGDELMIHHNYVLTNIDGLANLTSVGGELRVTWNQGLTNLNGLTSVASVQGRLNVSDNRLLADCSALSALLGAPSGPPFDEVLGDIEIEDNAEGCNSIWQIVDPAAAAFVERLYVNILGRPSDQAGLKSWLDTIKSQSASAVALGFLNSAEFKSRDLDDAAFVDTLYRTLFDREGDTAGVDYWLGELASGRLRDMVIWGFLRAAEFKTLSDSFGVTALNAADESAYGIRAFVERFYIEVLGRQPEQAGFDDWVIALTNGSYAGGDIAKAFFLSAEYLNQNTTDSAFIETAYQAFFGRDADAAGKQGWLEILSGGETREYVLNGFIGSAEFAALAASYGINVSSTREVLDRSEDGTNTERRTQEAEDAETIPALPAAFLLLLAALVSLFGSRRLQSV